LRKIEFPADKKRGGREIDASHLGRETSFRRYIAFSEAPEFRLAMAAVAASATMRSAATV
jgi:hypothetical protein